MQPCDGSSTAAPAPPLLFHFVRRFRWLYLHLHKRVDLETLTACRDGYASQTQSLGLVFLVLVAFNADVGKSFKMLPEHHWWNAELFDGFSEGCMKQILNSLACILFPLCLIEGLMPFGACSWVRKGVDWVVQQQQQQTNPLLKATIVVPSFLLF